MHRKLPGVFMQMWSHGPKRHSSTSSQYAKIARYGHVAFKFVTPLVRVGCYTPCSEKYLWFGKSNDWLYEVYHSLEAHSGHLQSYCIRSDTDSRSFLLYSYRWHGMGRHLIDCIHRHRCTLVGCLSSSHRRILADSLQAFHNRGNKSKMHNRHDLFLCTTHSLCSHSHRVGRSSQNI